MANEARPCLCDIGDRFDYGGRGQEVQVEHIKAYVCKPAASTDKAVIVIHDIFGWQLPNTRYMADMLATNGYISKELKLVCTEGIFQVLLIQLFRLIKDSDDISSLLNPTFFIFAEKDDLIPLRQITLLEQKLKKNCKVDYEVKIYPGQTHGFVHRRREDINPQDKPYVEEGRKDMINWLNKYI
ncbi:PREDICTED: LOW QUALITY PROTEIN: carboxymethylenebutenolidase homolog [Chlamydotis macqueenii]|uniref:LOW QUALITY PROTEIN: carboxymethylenebutenolidase homolog n=1 Tax=Chlamydotis macqueenii TaxID=187382 RepID=UPI0005298C85|nr:PREDICTED: LOW QUALITY PROTEIN: carboxymethylenebutenolidase homolog [Chlamydotis macqueenii]